MATPVTTLTAGERRAATVGFLLIGMALVIGVSQPQINGWSMLAMLQALAGLALVLEATRRG